MTAQELIAENKILEALERGEAENLPTKGKPLDLEAYFQTPEPLRMAFSILKSANVAPEEVELLKEIHQFERSLEELGNVDEAERRRLRLRISELRARYEMKMQRHQDRNP